MKGKVCFEKAMFYRFLEKDKEQSAYLDTAFHFLVDVNDSIAGKALHFKQILLEKNGRYKEALETGHKALELRKKLNSRDSELNSLLQIGYTYDRMGEYQEAIKWYEKGLQLKGVKNENFIGRNYGLIGIAYDELNDYEKAVTYNLQAIEHFKKVPNSSYLHTWYSNLGNTYLKMGKLDLAEKYTLLALEDAKNFRYITQINLGKIYLSKGKNKEAESILLKATEALQNLDEPISLSAAYETLSELYKKKGDYKNALDYYEKYSQNEEKRLSLEKVKQLNELTVQYETAEKEKQIAEKELALKNRNQWIFGLVALAIIIGLIGFLMYKQQALKNIQQQKDNELKLALEKIESQNKLQEQRLSISRDLHDNIGAQLSFIVSAIDTIKYYISDKNKELTDRLDTIGTFAKETIQELRDTIWAMNKSGISIEDLQGRIANFIEKAKQSYPNIHISVTTDTDNTLDTSYTGMQGLNIFRIVQEATNNALKYADANQIEIHINQVNDVFHFAITDDGKGFVENEIEAGNGLLNMRKRAMELGSELILESTPNKGTRIAFSFQDKI